VLIRLACDWCHRSGGVEVWHIGIDLVKVGREAPLRVRSKALFHFRQQVKRHPLWKDLLLTALVFYRNLARAVILLAQRPSQGSRSPSLALTSFHIPLSSNVINRITTLFWSHLLGAPLF
jgi:hypothetical protein